MEETSSSISAMEESIQNLLEQFRAVVVEKDELEFRNISELKSVLLLLAYYDSDSDEEIIF